MERWEKRSLEGGGDGQKLNFIPWGRQFNQHEQTSDFEISLLIPISKDTLANK